MDHERDRSLLIENAKFYKDNGKAPYETASGNYMDWMELIHHHFQKFLLPKINELGESFVEYWPAYCLWNHREKTKIGRNFDNWSQFVYSEKKGVFGSGYMCVTDAAVYIFCSASLSDKYRMFSYDSMSGFAALLAGMALGKIDDRMPTKHDEYWRVPYEKIFKVEIIYPTSNTERIRLVSSIEVWEISRFFTDTLHTMRLAIQMGLSGEYKRVLNRKYPADLRTDLSKETLEILEKLHQLHQAGILSVEEYQDKKQQLIGG